MSDEQVTQQQPPVDETEEQRLKREKKEKKEAEKKKRREEQKLRDKEKKKLKKQQKKEEGGGADANATTTTATTTTAHATKKVNADGINVKKTEDFGEWFTQVITKSEMIEYYDVSGCYILRPYSYEIWEQIKTFVDSVIKKMGVKNAMFPLFVTKGALEKEKDHVEGFSAEVAWVTKSGQSDLAEPLAIRPTSETIMYPAYAKWVRSYRDLPLKLNQWTNVVRWEFKHAVPFIRSREFLWQEGHTAFATEPEAREEVYQILDMYRRVYEELLAVPVVKGKKSESEKFAGGYYTTSVEAFIPTNGRAVQGATSHCLGQNFSKMFDIQFESEQGGEKQFAWQNSWGLTTRTIGVMTMVHGDNDGVVFPPRVAPTQVVIVPLYFKDRVNNETMNQKAKELYELLSDAGIRAELDTRDYKNPGFKFSYWEVRGVPLRIELGPKDLEQGQITLVKRYNREKFALSLTDLKGSDIQTVLDNIQQEMFNRAKEERDSRMPNVLDWSEFMTELNKGNMCLAPWCDRPECEEQIKQRSKRDSNEQEALLTASAKSLCIPLEQPALPANQKCVNCDHDAKLWCLFGRSY